MDKLQLENEKLALEIENLKHGQRWQQKLLDAAPFIATLVAIASIWLGFSDLKTQRKGSLIAAEESRTNANHSRIKELQNNVWEKRLDAYFLASEAAAVIATSDDDALLSKAKSDFWKMYYGPLAIVEDKAVASAMIKYGSCLASSSTCSKNELGKLSLGIADTMRESIRDTWEISEELAEIANKFQVLAQPGHAGKLSELVDRALEQQDKSSIVSRRAIDASLSYAYDKRELFKGKTVLWVDDQPSNNKYVASMLAELGVSVTEVTGNDIARVQLENNRFDVVISDISRNSGSESGVGMGEIISDVETQRPALIYYVSRPRRPPPFGSIGITNRIDELFDLLVVAFQSY